MKFTRPAELESVDYWYLLGEKAMFLVEEKKSRNGQSSASIYMRADGLFEAHIYRADGNAKEATPFEVCGVTETLKPLEAIVDEELGL